MLKNVIIVNDFDYIQGGASKVAIQTANMLLSIKDLNVYFFSAVHSEESNLDKKIIRICTNQGEAMHAQNKVKGIFNGIYNGTAKRELKKLLNTLNREETIIHVHGWTKALSCSVFDIAFQLNFKTVLTMHDYFTACPNGGYFNYKENKICKIKPMSFKCIRCNCDSRNYLFKLYRVVRLFVQNKIVKLNSKLKDVISISDFSERVLKRTLNPNVIIHRVYNPMDLDNDVQKIDYIKNKYFLYVGRVSKEKGVDIFCEAVTQSGKNGIVVGDGAELQNLMKKYKNVNFVGWKNADEVREYIKGARALVFPSRWYECSPLVPLEAMQYGIPVLTSDCNATTDYINKNNGEVFCIDGDELKNILINFKNIYKPSIDSFRNNYTEILYNEYEKIMYKEGTKD